MGLALLLLASLVLHLQFSTGQVVATRDRLVNATDAAAYSVGVWRARAMNYYAYTNRTIVASEVAIAQAATMVSYAKFLERFTDNVNDVAQFVPVVGEVTAALKEVAYWVSELTQATATTETAARSAYVAALVASQQAMFVATQPVMLSRLAAEVARENDRRFFAFTLPTALDPSFTDPTRVRSGAERDRLRDLVLRSLDGFTVGRDADLPFDLPCLPMLLRRGATQLIRDHDTDTYERWQAYDTLSVHSPRGLFCSRRETLPLGWGAAEIAVDPKRELDALDALPPMAGTEGSSRNGNDTASASGADASKRANPRAYQEASDEIWVADGYRGIASVRELDFEDHPTVQANPRFPLLRAAVVGRVQDARATGSSQATGHGAGRIQPVDRFAGRPPAVMGAVALSEVYFRRPPQSADRVEYASLFNPYWQARLGEVPEAIRDAATGYVR